MSHILVTGGAGYIGAHVVKLLISKGYKVSILDNLVNGHIETVPEEVNFYQVDLADKEGVNAIFEKNNFDAVMHFAAFIEAGISMQEPGKFFTNNCSNGINLLEAMTTQDVGKLIFSSTAALYGDPIQTPIKEDHPLQPVNHYGTTKLIFEKVLKMYMKTYDLKYIALRYFNAAGADQGSEIGEDHDPETHLIPLVLQTALGKRDEIKIFGTDYDTEDGTCVRDYIHVSDLADAHLLALENLLEGGESDQFNLGNGKGFSVREVIEAAKKVTEKDIKVVEDARREGDPAILIADSTKIKKKLGWDPKFTSIDGIIESAWNWHKDHPEGF
jgi:UDP-glucose 4-epimerase